MSHHLSADGIQLLSVKVRAIREASVPRNMSELKLYLGSLAYYGKFLPNLSQLLKKSTSWKWSKAEESAFHKSKELLLSSSPLVHFVL